MYAQEQAAQLCSFGAVSFPSSSPIRAMSENVLIKSATSILYYKIVISIIAFLIGVVNGKKTEKERKVL